MSGIRPHTLPRPARLTEVGSVADVGAGIRPFQWYWPPVHICVEPHPPYANALADAGFSVLRLTAVRALPLLRVEAVYMLDVLEHMPELIGREALALAAEAAQRQVVVYTPFGFVPQTQDAWGMGGEEWQTHRSGWMPKDFPGWAIEPFGEEGFFAVLDRR